MTTWQPKVRRTGPRERTGRWRRRPPRPTAWRSLVSISRWPPGTSQPGPPRRPGAARRARPPRRRGRLAARRPGPPAGGTRSRRRHVGHIGDEDADPASQPGGQRLVQVSLVDVAPGDVPPGAAHRGRVDVGRVDLGPIHGGGQAAADRARAAAQVDDLRAPSPDDPGRASSAACADEELGAPPRDEHAGRDGDPQAAELRPAENLLERQAGDAPVHHRVEFVRCPGGGHEQTGFVLGENATRGPEPANDDRSETDISRRNPGARLPRR